MVRNTDSLLLEGVCLGKYKHRPYLIPFSTPTLVNSMEHLDSIGQGHQAQSQPVLEFLKMYICASSGWENTFFLYYSTNCGQEASLSVSSVICVIKWPVLILILAGQPLRVPREKFSHSLQLCTLKNTYIFFSH